MLSLLLLVCLAATPLACVTVKQPDAPTEVNDNKSPGDKSKTEVNVNTPPAKPKTEVNVNN
jgi:hypothetical protein